MTSQPLTSIRLRPARQEEADELSALCLRSKAHWGYDAAFIAACAPHLRVTPDAIPQGHSTVAENDAGEVIGVVQIAPGETEHGNLDLLFVEPQFIGQGVGRRLFEHARQALRDAGETRMTILSDPDAEATYLHMGAKRVEMRPSDVFKDRELPWLELALQHLP